MYELYETVYNIYNHLNTEAESRPLASVAMFPVEDINDKGLLELIIRRYVNKEIYSIYGLNLEEFLNLPMDIAEMLIDIANDEKVKKLQTMNQAANELKSMVK